MSGQRPASVHLRRTLPLIAAAFLLAPGAALASAPSPDQPPDDTALAPDPAPVAFAPSVRAPQAVTPRLTVAPSRTVAVPAPVATPVPAPTHKPHARTQVRHRQRPQAVPVVDVMPAAIDLHPGLGALPTLPRDDSRLVLAAAALLAAAAAAGTGTMLTLTARARP